MLTNITLFQRQPTRSSRQKPLRRRALDLFVAGAVIFGSAVGTVSGAMASPVQQLTPSTALSNKVFLPLTSIGVDVDSIPLPDDISIQVEPGQEQPEALELPALGICSSRVSENETIRPHQTKYIGEYRASGNCPFIAVRLNRPGLVLIAYNRYGYWESKGWRRVYAGQSTVTRAELASNTPIRVWVRNPYSYSWHSPYNRYNVQIYK